ncbi:MAG: hypothetical protein JWR26_4982 [Pedosphaera sp.]|nr:hypothetical protein [Pedosphaera sp.]
MAWRFAKVFKAGLPSGDWVVGFSGGRRAGAVLSAVPSGLGDLLCDPGSELPGYCRVVPPGLLEGERKRSAGSDGAGVRERAGSR